MDNPNLAFLLVAFVWILNFAISCWNAYVTGKMWTYTKQMGGWQHFMTWMGYIMSVCGFSWCLLIPLALAAYVFGWYGFEIEALKACLNLGYIILAPVIVFAGLFIWLDSLAHAWRERTLASTAIAGWNTYAQISNMIEVFSNIGPAFENVSDFFSSGGKSSDSDSDSDSGNGAVMVLVILLVAIALIGGILLATAIVVRTARNEAKAFKQELRESVQDQRPKKELAAAGRRR